MYEPLIQLQAALGDRKITHGKKGNCRFCGTDEARLFRQVAHLVPEALGNRSIFSADECDVCNQKFSLYEDALVAAIGPLLTLGGTAGKGGKVRQTGRSAGNTVLSHNQLDGKRQIRIISRDVEDYKERVTRDGDWIVMRTPLPPTPFNPLFAYKALIKMALALLPAADLESHSRLRKFLLDRDALAPQGQATLSMSFGSIGNAPPLVLASLLQRVDSALLIPKFLFIVCAGSVCLQLFLTEDGHPDTKVAWGTPRLRFNAIFGKPGAEDMRISYSHLNVLDWSSPTSQCQPLKEMILRFHPRSTHGEFVPVWR